MHNMCTACTFRMCLKPVWVVLICVLAVYFTNEALAGSNHVLLLQIRDMDKHCSLPICDAESIDGYCNNTHDQLDCYAKQLRV